MVMRWVGGWVSLLLAMTLLIGCGASDLDEESGLEGGRDGLQDSALDSDSRGSLAEAQGGTLGRSGSQGPLEDILFAYNSVDLDSRTRQVLQRNAAWLEEHPGARVEIEGHCDDRGTIEYNLALGARRAAAAKDYLTALGISASRITTISYGEELPLCREATESCWARNRRGHFVVFEQ